MWGNTSAKSVSTLQNVREMYVSNAGHRIVYNASGKDNFQVSIIENNLSYPMGDIDYFTIDERENSTNQSIRLKF